MRHQWVVAVVYALVALIGAIPEMVSPLDITPIQAEAILLILLVVMAHGLVWEFMVGTAEEHGVRHPPSRERMALCTRGPRGAVAGSAVPR